MKAVHYRRHSRFLDNLIESQQQERKIRGNLRNLFGLITFLRIGKPYLCRRNSSDVAEQEGVERGKITTGIPRGNEPARQTIRTIIPILTKLTLHNPSQRYKRINRAERCNNSVALLFTTRLGFVKVISQHCSPIRSRGS